MTATAAPPLTFANFRPGDPVPYFQQACGENPQFNFDSVAGRYVVLCFYGSAGDEKGRRALEGVQANRQLFDDTKLAFFGVSLDAADRAEGRAREALPGIRHFWDADWKVSRLYGAVPREAAPGQNVRLRRFWLVLEPSLRVRAVFPFAPDGAEQERLFAYLRDLPPVHRFAGIEIPAPILVIPQVFEPEFCRHLIGLYEADGGEESGFMREVDGKTVGVHDGSFKRRRDYTIVDQELRTEIQRRIQRRVRPEIERVHFFTPTRMERYIVSCYAAEDGGHFAAHRDNTTAGTAHRRYAVSINLNDDFEGGEVSFPEYGPRSYKAPLGGAVVFSCPLLHAVSRVTRGRRYAFLPFLYDEAAAKIREQNNERLGEGVGAYKGA